MSDETRLARVEPSAELAAQVERPDRLALAVAAWLDSKQGKSGSARTLHSYRDTLGDFRAALLAVGLDLASAGPAVALAAQSWAKQSKVEGRELKPATVAQRLATLSSFYDFARRRQLLDLGGNPIDLVERPKVESYADAQGLDPATVRRQLAALKVEAAGDGQAAELAARDLALLRVALTTGRRVAELAALRWRDVEVAEGRRVTCSFRRAKGGKVMRDTLAPAVAAELLAWLHRHYGAELGSLGHEAPIWPALKGGGVAGRARVGQALSAQGIGEVVAKRLQTHPHALRHSFAQGMEKSGAKVSDVQARLGHSSLATTGRYLAQLNKADNPHAERLADMFSAEDEL